MVAAAVAFGVVFSLAALEVAARALGIAPPLPPGAFVADSLLPWKMATDRVERHRTDEFDVHYTHNSLGFRGRDLPFEKPPGVFRIVGIGDSFTYGQGVDDDATYLARLEVALGARTVRRVEAINLGIPRYWPEPEALVLEHYGLKFQPDLVIVGLTSSDIEDTLAGRRRRWVSRGYLVTDRLGDWADIGRWLYLRSDVARVLIHSLINDAHDVKVERGVGTHWEVIDAVRLGVAVRLGAVGRGVGLNGTSEPIWTRMADAFDRMVRLSAAAGAEIVFLYLPHRGALRTVDTDDALAPTRAGRMPLPRTAGSPILTLQARLRQFCAARARDCEVVDLLPAMQAHSQPDSLFYRKDGHYTEAGNGFIAEVLGRELEERGLLPAGGAASGAPSAAR